MQKTTQILRFIDLDFIKKGFHINYEILLGIHMKNKFLILILTATIAYGATSSDRGAYYYHKKSQFEMLAQNNKYKTVMLGDSITDGGLWNELLNNDLIQNRGIAGDTTDGVLERLDSINTNIEKVFIMIGINDIFQEKSVEYIFINYKKIIEILKTKNIKVYIQSTLYVGHNKPEIYNQKVEQLNKLLKEYCQKNNLEYVNLNEILAPNKVLKEEFSYDKLHLNGTAYSLWRDKIKDYFLEH